MKNCPGARPSRLRRMLALATATLTGAAGLGLAAGVATTTPAAAATSKQLVIAGDASITGVDTNLWRFNGSEPAYDELEALLADGANWSGGGFTVRSTGIADVAAPGALDGVDVFFTAIPTGGSYSGPQSDALAAFVQRGGHLVVNGNKVGFGDLPGFIQGAGFNLRSVAGFYPQGGCLGYGDSPAGIAPGTYAAGGGAAQIAGGGGVRMYHTVNALTGALPVGAVSLATFANTGSVPVPAGRIFSHQDGTAPGTGVTLEAVFVNTVGITSAQLLVNNVATGAAVTSFPAGAATFATGAQTGTLPVRIQINRAVGGPLFTNTVNIDFGGAGNTSAVPLVSQDRCQIEDVSNNDFSTTANIAALVPPGAIFGANSGAVIVTSDLDVFSSVYEGLAGGRRTFAVNTFQYILNNSLGVDFNPAASLRPGVAANFTGSVTAGSAAGATFTWSFTGASPSIASSTSATPVVTFGTEGVATVRLTIRNGAGAVGTTVKTFDVGTSSFVPLANPVRIYNTRTEGGLIGPNSTRSVPIRGRGNIPSDARSVIMNVTVVDSTTGGYLQVWPTGDAQPSDTSTHNFRPNETFPNLVVSRIGNDGTVSVYNNAGTVHILVDAVGYTLANSTGSRLTSVTPARLFNTRDGDNITRGPLGQGETRSVQVRGIDNIPQGATAVVLNLTADQATTTGSFVTAWPSGQPRPTDTSNLNLIAGVTRPNVAVVAIGAGGRIDLYNEFGTTELFADVVGYFGPATLGGITGVTPQRVFNTRSGIGTTATPMGPGESRQIQVRGVAGVPADARTAILKVTVDASSAGGYLSVGPNAFTGEPTFSNLNFQPGMTVPNLVISQIGSDGRVRVYNNAGTVTVLVDILGYAD